jgi:acyl-coenzyme A thioesterase PaaI-like protein
MTSAVLDPGGMSLEFVRPVRSPMPPPTPDPQTPEEFFDIEPGEGPMTRLHLADRLRNPWGILHGVAVATLVDVAACRAVAGERADGAEGDPRGGEGAVGLAAGDTVIHYLRPARVGPVEPGARSSGPWWPHPGVRLSTMSAPPTGWSTGPVAVLDVDEGGQPTGAARPQPSVRGDRPRSRWPPPGPSARTVINAPVEPGVDGDHRVVPVELGSITGPQPGAPGGRREEQLPGRTRATAGPAPTHARGSRSANGPNGVDTLSPSTVAATRLASPRKRAMSDPPRS